MIFPEFKKRTLAKLIAASLLVTPLVGCLDGDDDDDTTEETVSAAFTLQLLHVSDIDGSNSDALANVGNFASNLAALKADYPDNTLFLSSGDNYIPGSVYDAADDDSMADVSSINVPGVGRAHIAWLNEMGLQASAVGNHDLDGGTAEFASIIAQETDDESGNTYIGADFPYLSANMDFSADENTADYVVDDIQLASNIPNSLASSTIIIVDGEAIGIVGATTPTEEDITSTGDVTVTPESDDTTELAAIIQTEVDALIDQGVNKVVLLAHMQTISVEQELATLLSGVDIIVAGGSNTLLADSTDRLLDGDTAADDYPLFYQDVDGNDVALVNVDGDYKYLGRLVIGFDEDGQIITSTVDADESGVYVSDDTMVAELGGAANTEVDTVTDAVSDLLLEAEGNIFGHTDVFINGIRAQVRSEETSLGDLTADANLWYAQQEISDVQVSIKNGGGIRAAIGYYEYPAGSTNADDLEYYPPAAYDAAGKAEGDISQYDIQTALSFNNELAVIDVTAAELKDLVEHAVAATVSGDETVTAGQFGQFAGLNFTYDPSYTAIATTLGDDNTYTVDTEGERVRELVVGDDVVVSDGVIQGDETRSFSVVTLSYLLEQGDGYPFSCTYNGTYCTDATYLAGNDDQAAMTDIGNADFADAGTEQDALAEYLAAFYPDADNAFDIADDIFDSSVVDERIIRDDSTE
ncbi:MULTISPECIES: bifunctional UDP-sugar hydrolase/5'-nucleotidase [unclassified Vibrio]|uniref:Bifunctional metallophosphatase/5'-nucleotidase n=1 Tax=Vibrio sp. HB236076 TaxID=3232307 RepID=A0AB39H8P7_9VIBR|nr:bifunctional metallophosphatase/5'-nucleotidase [Vibrio sp. HB161653]MDP5253778.1 bifunctional metallophosphatase/5'-nucleotidase [Vibrio sp. HB161653]